MTMTKDRWLKAARVTKVSLIAAMMVAVSGATALAAVIVQGNRRVDAETIRSYVTGQGAGSTEEARRQLLATGLFSDVRISRSGSNIVVAVRENDVVNRVVFEGNKKLTKDVLRGEVQTKERGPYSQAQLDADVQRILEIYKRGGRGLASVTYRLVPLENGRVDVVFTIKEGDKTGVKEINFVGNQIYSSSRLRNLMTTTEMNLLSFFKTSDVYDPDKIASDEELIRRFYLKHGYADFRIVNTDAQFDAARGGWVVTITVDEGQQYRVAGVKVESRIPDVPETTLSRQVRTSAGEVYDAEEVEKTLTGMTTEVARKGYAFAQVRPQGVRDPASHTISLSYVVEEGPRVYVEKIVVRGNTRTRDYVVRRELDLAEGDAYNKVLIDRAERRLNALGFFKKVRITNEPGSTPDRVIVNIDVEDQPTGQFSISGGYSTADGFIGDVSVSESNFLGRGQYVKVGGQVGQRTKGIDFSFTEPYFLGRRMSAGFDLFNKFNDNTQYSRYESRTAGGQLRLGLPVTDEFSVLLRYSLYQTRIKVPDTYNKPYNDCTFPLPGYTTLNADGTATYPNCAYDGEASVAIKEAQGRTVTSLGGVTLAYNTLDNPRDPHNGIYAELKPDVAGLGGDSKFVRVSGEAKYYRELFDDVVGLVKVQGGHIQAFGGDNLRLVDHYFLGPSLVRGFETSGIGPRDLNGDPRSNAIGGTTYFGATAEAQFPIPGIPRELGIKGAVFADAGTLFGYKGNRAFDINGNGAYDCGRKDVQPECVAVQDSHKIRSSVGASILWNSPLGPIRFDYAFALSKADGDRTQAFRFSGGSRF
jgi:outer membrane protein insertion porin family